MTEKHNKMREEDTMRFHTAIDEDKVVVDSNL